MKFLSINSMYGFVIYSVSQFTALPQDAYTDYRDSYDAVGRAAVTDK